MAAMYQDAQQIESDDDLFDSNVTSIPSTQQLLKEAEIDDVFTVERPSTITAAKPFKPQVVANKNPVKGLKRLNAPTKPLFSLTQPSKSDSEPFTGFSFHKLPCVSKKPPVYSATSKDPVLASQSLLRPLQRLPKLLPPLASLARPVLVNAHWRSRRNLQFPKSPRKQLRRRHFAMR